MSTNAYTHELKTDHEPFSAVLIGEKKHEIRLDDRDFKVGDTLILRETRYTRAEMVEDGRPLEYTGRTVERVVTHIQRGYGLPSGHVVMSLGEPSRRDALYRKALAMGDDPGVIGGAARIPAISDEWFAGRNVWGSTRAQWLEFVRQYAYAPTQLIDTLAAPAPAPVIADTAGAKLKVIDKMLASVDELICDRMKADPHGTLDKALETARNVRLMLAETATPASSGDTAGAKPVAKFDDPRVQTVYELICDGQEPPKGEHWDGFVARRIVDALFAAPPAPSSDTAGAKPIGYASRKHLDLIDERHPALIYPTAEDEWTVPVFAATPAPSVAALDEATIDTLRLALGYIGSTDRPDRLEHVGRIRALIAAGVPSVADAARNKALEEAAEICKTWNTTPGSRLAAEILALKDSVADAAGASESLPENIDWTRVMALAEKHGDGWSDAKGWSFHCDDDLFNFAGELAKESGK